jgi:hypothetical protein
MDRMAGGFPMERIFSTTVSGQPKTDILKVCTLLRSAFNLSTAWEWMCVSE